MTWQALNNSSTNDKEKEAIVVWTRHRHNSTAKELLRREYEEGLERCGWTTSEMEQDCLLKTSWTQLRTGPNGEGLWLKQEIDNDNDINDIDPMFRHVAIFFTIYVYNKPPGVSRGSPALHCLLIISVL